MEAQLHAGALRRHTTPLCFPSGSVLTGIHLGHLFRSPGGAGLVSPKGGKRILACDR